MNGKKLHVSKSLWFDMLYKPEAQNGFRKMNF
jgi:hypothetical protein